MARIPLDRLRRLTQEMAAHWDEFGADKEVGGMKRQDLIALGEAYEQKLDAWTALEQQLGLAASARDEASDALYDALVRYRDGIKSLTGRSSIESKRLPTISVSRKPAGTGGAKPS